jgi:hypothetical protein
MKNKLPLLLLLLILTITSCSKEDIEEDKSYFELLSEEEKEIVTYFESIALGFEFGNASWVTRKWQKPMRIFVGGEPSPEMITELGNITSEINSLASDGFYTEVVTDSLQSNFYIFLGSAQGFTNIYPGANEHVQDNWGVFSIFFNGSDYIYKGNMFVDIYRPQSLEAKKHLLREELTQSLGLGRDSEKYEESIFQQNWTTVTQYSEIDRELIRILYHPDMSVGLNSRKIKEVVAKILLGQ